MQITLCRPSPFTRNATLAERLSSLLLSCANCNTFWWWVVVFVRNFRLRIRIRPTRNEFHLKGPTQEDSRWFCFIFSTRCLWGVWTQLRRSFLLSIFKKIEHFLVQGCFCFGYWELIRRVNLLLLQSMWGVMTPNSNEGTRLVGFPILQQLRDEAAIWVTEFYHVVVKGSAELLLLDHLHFFREFWRLECAEIMSRIAAVPKSRCNVWVARTNCWWACLLRLLQSVEVAFALTGLNFSFARLSWDRWSS